MVSITIISNIDIWDWNEFWMKNYYDRKMRREKTEKSDYSMDLNWIESVWLDFVGVQWID